MGTMETQREERGAPIFTGPSLQVNKQCSHHELKSYTYLITLLAQMKASLGMADDNSSLTQ